MNQLTKQLLCLTALVSAGQLFAVAGTVSKIIPRSQSFNAARQMIAWNNPDWGINRYPQDKYYASFNATFAYTRTFRSNSLTRALFGDDVVCGPCDDLGIHISGSAVPNRASTDWLADYFGLPRDFQSTVTFKPMISNFILDFSFYAGLDSWIDGLYFRVHAPFVHTKWNLNANECVSNPGTAYNGSYFQGYFSSAVVPTSSLNTQFLNYTNGCVPTINNDFTSTDEAYCSLYSCTPLDKITWKSLCCSRISNECDCDGSALTRNGLAEIRAVFGWNFLNDEEEDYHVGLGIYAAAPTGTRIGDTDCDDKGKSLYLFEPIVGNGKHWELGAQVTGHYIFWRNSEDTRSLGFYLESNITHLFGASQTRCFDLDSAGSNSRYMLAQLLDSNRNSYPRLQSGLGTVDELALEFADVYAPVANITRRNVKSTIAVQADVAVTLAYQSNNFQWDIGYDFWGRTCEDLCIDDCCPTQVGNWVLKGDQRVYGFTESIPYLVAGPDVAVRLAVSDSLATINTGSNAANGLDYTPANPTAPFNQYADNPVLAISSDGFPIYQLPSAASNQIFTSNPPVFITESDFDLTGSKGISNKVFTNFNWKWNNNSESKWTPYLSIGGEIEWGRTESDCGQDCEKSCNPCSNSCSNSCNPCDPCATPCYTATFDTTPCPSLPRRAPSPATCVKLALSQWGIWLKVGSSYN